ncbi:MAG: hypothetical protein A2946_00870 [Candidatus Liptonbacteria bacterium RIFCSPLOWO2_01_FULL_53_13]|uniref:Type 4 fimbrial biogenesis protein PilX N-terminal domain-containing protein n=1 Tax=Candidatus Liptonbacteria bacterium RIFCSPLOWO2_01_FULL_53_13 TaxID=1798651 RepID=A0A1G2CH02_9BACT|nr:MAG: hypothetical protein A2946_00870 [Candidatus Liptonbacteria bacterium RIFCSPLOWO2_01_FULL_53_13]
MKQFSQNGQVMILTVVAIGGTLLAATTVAGLLVVYQLRQSSDAVNSAKAIFAADAGIEWGLYQFFKPALAGGGGPAFSNSASVTISCFPGTSCKDASTNLIKVVGRSANAARALELSWAP